MNGIKGIKQKLGKLRSKPDGLLGSSESDNSLQGTASKVKVTDIVDRESDYTLDKQ